MQIDLSEATQQVLAAQAVAHGRTLPEYAASLLCRYAETAKRSLTESSPVEVKTHEDAVAWILSRNPTFDSNHPEDIDWQQFKSEGRRF